MPADHFAKAKDGYWRLTFLPIIYERNGGVNAEKKVASQREKGWPSLGQRVDAPLPSTVEGYDQSQDPSLRSG